MVKIKIWTYAAGLRIFGFCGCTETKPPPPPSQWLHWCIKL